MYGLTQFGARPQQVGGIAGFTQQTNGIDIGSIMSMMIPLIMVVMMMKMMTGAMGSSSSKMKPVEAAP